VNPGGGQKGGGQTDEEETTRTPEEQQARRERLAVEYQNQDVHDKPWVQKGLESAMAPDMQLTELEFAIKGTYRLVETIDETKAKYAADGVKTDEDAVWRIMDKLRFTTVPPR
jgi:hypothetical protein